MFLQNSVQANKEISTRPLPMMYILPRTISKPTPTTELMASQLKETPVKKTMIWGRPTWTVFHTLAFKVRPEAMANSGKRGELLQNLQAICFNLPCPDCASHAKTYLTTRNFLAIQTKQQLKDFFFHFHNYVNERKGFPQFIYSQVDELYATKQTKTVLEEFMCHFEDKHPSPHMISDDLYRQRIAGQLKKWFKDNYMMFEF